MGSKRHRKRRGPRVTVRKATPAPEAAAHPPRSDGDEDDENQLYRLRDMKIPFVSLVTAGANRMRQWMVVKDDSDAAKAVPPADADRETKHQAQQARARQYGIEVKAVGSALSYPAGAPTTESMYGDPVNLAYPFGGPNNAVMLGRVRNALARFKQNYDQYTQASSRGRVYERIVRRALAEGINVSYDPNDPVDRLLPADLKQRLSKQADGAPTAGASAGPDGPDAASYQADLDAWHAQISTRIIELQLAMTQETAALEHLAKSAPAPPVRPPASATQAPAHEHVGPGVAPPTPAAGTFAPANPPLQAALAKAAQLEEENARLRAEARRLRKQRYASVGSASALIAGDAPAPRTRRAPGDDDGPAIDLPLNGSVNWSAAITKMEEGDKSHARK